MNTLKITPRVGGHYRLQAVNIKTGKVRELADWFENLILDAGLNRIGTGGLASWVQVGSGSTAPVNANTALQNFVAGTNAITGSLYGAQSVAPYFGWARYSWRFPAGAAAGNLSEVGVGWAESGSLFSRALIKDNVGAPTTITVLGDEYLDVTYELRLYPPAADSVATVVISGVSYDITVRPSGVNSQSWAPLYLLAYGFTGGGVGPPNVQAYQGPLGTVLEGPSGGAAGGPGAVFDAYANNSKQRTGKFNFALTEGNLAGGIGALLWSTTLVFGAYQIGFNPKLPKDGTKVLSLTWVLNWDRYTP